MFNHNYALMLIKSARHNLIGREFEWLSEVDDHDKKISRLEKACYF